MFVGRVERDPLHPDAAGLVDSLVRPRVQRRAHGRPHRCAHEQGEDQCRVGRSRAKARCVGGRWWACAHLAHLPPPVRLDEQDDGEVADNLSEVVSLLLHVALCEAVRPAEERLCARVRVLQHGDGGQARFLGRLSTWSTIDILIASVVV